MGQQRAGTDQVHTLASGTETKAPNWSARSLANAPSPAEGSGSSRAHGSFSAGAGFNHIADQAGGAYRRGVSAPCRVNAPASREFESHETSDADALLFDQLPTSMPAIFAGLQMALPPRRQHSNPEQSLRSELTAPAAFLPFFHSHVASYAPQERQPSARSAHAVNAVLTGNQPTWREQSAYNSTGSAYNSTGPTHQPSQHPSHESMLRMGSTYLSSPGAPPADPWLRQLSEPFKAVTGTRAAGWPPQYQHPKDVHHAATHAATHTGNYAGNHSATAHRSATALSDLWAARKARACEPVHAAESAPALYNPYNAQESAPAIYNPHAPYYPQLPQPQAPISGVVPPGSGVPPGWLGAPNEVNPLASLDMATFASLDPSQLPAGLTSQDLVQLQAALGAMPAHWPYSS